jgi:hypothetical protein
MIIITHPDGPQICKMEISSAPVEAVYSDGSIMFTSFAYDDIEINDDFSNLLKIHVFDSILMTTVVIGVTRGNVVNLIHDASKKTVYIIY